MKPTSHKQFSVELLDRYLAGEAGSEEIEAVHTWMAENETREREVASLSAAVTVNDTDAAWSRVFERSQRSIQPHLSSSRSLPKWALYAAGCVVLAILSLRVFQHKPVDPKSAAEAYTTYTTRAGQRASLTLRDGARVILGPLTTLRVVKDAFPNSGTTVEVNGEALFNVEHSSKAPFQVTAHGVATRVLGTEFIVRAYDASLVRVAVRDGRVSVQSPVFTSANAAIVNAGEVVSATPNALPVVTPITDIATDFAWANGELVLRNVPLGEGLVRLSRWYGMEFRVADPELLRANVDIAFPSAFDQADIDLLATAIKAHVKRSGNIFTFSKTS